MKGVLPRYLLFGQLSRDYVIFPSSEAFIDVPGGNALYSAIGLVVWKPDPRPAIIARVGEDYPQEWLENFEHCGLDMQGVNILPQAVDLRFFAAFSDRKRYAFDDPVAHFARLGLPFPKALLGYKDSAQAVDSRTNLSPVSLRQDDIPADFMDASTAHFCPLDYLTHSLLPSMLRQAGFTTITLDPSAGYMSPTFWDNVPSLLTGLTAFLPSEEEALSLFRTRSSDLWEIAEALAAYGCEIIVIKRGELGQLVYDAAGGHRWEIPPYPARLANPIGAGDAFCGGFLLGYRRTFDPLEAALYGNVSASLVVEGHAFDYALGALPGLPEARLEAQRGMVRRV